MSRTRRVHVGVVLSLVVASVGVACSRSESPSKGASPMRGTTSQPLTTGAGTQSPLSSVVGAGSTPGAEANTTTAAQPVARPAKVPTTWSDPEQRYYAYVEKRHPSDARMVLAGRPAPEVSWRIYIAADRDDKNTPYVYEESHHSQGGGGGYGPLTPPFDVGGGTVQPDHGLWYGIAPSNAARVVAFMGKGDQIASEPFGRDDRYPNLIFFAIVIKRGTTVDRIEAFDPSGRSLGRFAPGENQIIWEMES